MKRENIIRYILIPLSYLLVAVLSAGACCYVLLTHMHAGSGKLQEVERLIHEKFIDEVDTAAIEDAAAAAMVDALGNPWSYYIPAADYAAYQSTLANTYLGVGISITVREDGKGFDIIKVEAGGGAEAAGILPGDILVAVENENAAALGVSGTSALIRGEEGTFVSLTVERAGEALTVEAERKQIPLVITTGEMLEEDIGLVIISNFNDRCAEETIAVIEDLQSQGAKKLIFDIRGNPGGYTEEMIDLLDYLLPEGELFRNVNYAGKEKIHTSDDKCLKLPMAVVMNENSYSAAEFFAAALSEYEWATLVGQPTTGKSHNQVAYELSDGSAVNLSMAKYYTPKGVSLADVGGLKPDVEVAVDEQTQIAIYAGTLEPSQDPQLQAAISAVKTGE